VEERITEIEMIYIQNTSDDNYTVECMSRRKGTTKLNFSQVEGVEINARRPIEITNSFLQMSDKDNKMWNIKFAYPTEFVIKYMGKIMIEIK